MIPPTPRCTNDKPHFVVLLVELAQRVGERFERTLHVGLHDEVERGDLAALHHREDVFEAGAARQHHRVALRRGLAAVRTRLGDRAGDLVGRRDAQLVARERHVVEAEHLDRHRRTGFGDRPGRARRTSRGRGPTRGPATIVSPTRSVPSSTSAVTTGPRPWSRCASSTYGHGRLLRVGDELFGDLGVGDEQERVEQLVDTLARRRGDVDDDRVAAPLLGHELVAR